MTRGEGLARSCVAAPLLICETGHGSRRAAQVGLRPEMRQPTVDEILSYAVIRDLQSKAAGHG